MNPAPDPFLSGEALTRRGLLKASGAGGLALLLAGCSAAHSSGSSGVSGSGASSGSRSGKRRTVTIGTTTDLAPADLLRTGTNISTFSLVFDTLAGRDPHTGRATPNVATGVRWSSARTKLTVNLRDDVVYHTGRKLEPADAIFSIKTEETPTAGAQIGATAELIESIKVTGAHQFTMTLGKPVPSFENLLVLTPLIDRETFPGLYTAKKVVGTGPFVFESWTPGNQVTFRRNRQYWRRGLPALDGVDVRVYATEQALVAALRDDQISLAYNLVPAQAALLAKEGSFSVSTTAPAVSEYYVGANVKAKPFDDIRVRQAVAYALDRDRIVKQAFAGYGQATSIPWSTADSGVTAADANHYSYDPAKARALLKEAGASGMTVPVLTGAGNTITDAILNIVQYNLTAIGFKVKAEQAEATAFQAQLQAASIPGLWINSVGQAYLAIGTVLLGNAPLKVAKNTSNVTDPRYTKLADAVIYATSPSAEAAANAALTRYMLDEAWHITVGQTPGVSVGAKGLTGLATSPAGSLELTDARLA